MNIATMIIVISVLTLVFLCYFFWSINRILKKFETGLEEIKTGLERFETNMKQFNVGIFLLLVEHKQFSSPEIEKLGKELGLGEEIMGIALKRQKLPSAEKPLELKPGKIAQGEPL